METKRKKYPAGIQTFSEIIENGYQYVDKTALIYEMTHSYKYVFLSRPRRFGKSLLCSTLKSYFEGRNDLFEGLAMGQLEQEWTQYPVVHLSFASVKETTVDAISDQIDTTLSLAENSMGLEHESNNLGDRLLKLIVNSYEKYGQQVAVVIDEYDAPLLNNVGDEETLAAVRMMMRALFAPLKDCDPYLKFVFITGITKFSQLSIFSELNNLTNISMLPHFSTLCGITHEEMVTTFSDGIDELANANGFTREETIDVLRTTYDGYMFSENATAVYNPFSLVTAFATMRIGYYWFGSGTPTFLLKVLREFNTDITTIDGSNASEEQFDAPTEDMTSILPLFYQSGYLTIKSYDRQTKIYTLGYPNDEVRNGFMNALVPYYVTGPKGPNSQVNAAKIRVLLMKGQVEEALKLLQRFLKSIPYQEGTRQSEGHYTAMLYVVFMLVGVQTRSQVRTGDGRIDMLIEMSDRNYLMEVKLDGSSAEALKQIRDKDYDLAVTNDNPTTVIGMNFSTETATLTDWIIE